MANKLKMPTIDTIQRLHKAGLSNREIARMTGVHRQTVARYLAADEGISKSSIAPPGFEASDESDQPPDPGTETPTPPDPSASEKGRRSDCRVYAEEIESGLERGLSLKRIHQDLTEQFGESTPSYYSLRRFANRLNQRRELPFRRIETGPGEEAQIDFGTGAPVLDANGKRRRPWVFRIVLSYSRKAYSEAVYHQSTESFITALENAFHYFGGVPKRLVPDYVPRHIIRIMFPVQLCGHGHRSRGRTGGIGISGAHNGQRESSHRRSCSSSFQTILEGESR